MAEKRNQVLNFIKGLACIGVVFVHVGFPGTIGIIVSKLAQFAVPIFAMISGYYALGCDEETINRRLRKIAKIFLCAFVWWTIYTVFLHVIDNSLLEWIKSELSLKTLVRFIVFIHLDYAIPLWFLIGMIENYLFWYHIVKNGKEDKILKTLPFLFICQFALTTICETMNLSWSLKINFVTRIFSWFLLGYYIHKNEKKVLEKFNEKILFVTGVAGCIVALFPIVFKSKVNFSCVGLFFYSAAIFIVAIKNKDKFVSRIVEYIGDKLSLDVYIYHSIIAGLYSMLFDTLFVTKTDKVTFEWILPIITVITSIIVSYLIQISKNSIWKKV